MQFWEKPLLVGDMERAARERDMAQRCYQCAMGSPRIILNDGMLGHRVACNQFVECGNDPSFD